jgi:hypothetical protein
VNWVLLADGEIRDKEGRDSLAEVYANDVAWDSLPCAALAQMPDYIVANGLVYSPIDTWAVVSAPSLLSVDYRSADICTRVAIDMSVHDWTSDMMSKTAAEAGEDCARGVRASLYFVR